MLLISLDFEMFWGVSDSRSISGYRDNVLGEWDAIPGILDLFRRYDVKATWATVGMLLCRDYAQWAALRPVELPSYERTSCQNYALGAMVQENPKCFFGRDLAYKILETPGQELACHTYSHFFCGEAGVTPAQFSADLALSQQIFSELGVKARSLVFPRNQSKALFMPSLATAGIEVYRGNPAHWLYRDGHVTPGGVFGRAVRLADTWLPLTGEHIATPVRDERGLINVPATAFLRPWQAEFSALETLKRRRIKSQMTKAAQTGQVCHIWWHPHNFGVNVDQNLAMLEDLLQHFRWLSDKYGMRSLCMADFAQGSS